MNARRGLTLFEVLVVLAVVVVLTWLVVLPLRRRAIQARRTRCASNLNQLAKGIITYLGEHGDGRYLQVPLGRGRRPNDYNGAEWLAHLYWSGTVPVPGVFVCPSTSDTNHDGRDLGRCGGWPYGTATAAFGSQTVSYAGFHYRSITDTSGNPYVVRDDMPPDEPMASDDTQGTINHGEWNYAGMNVLFSDSHVEFRPAAELDPETAVGAPAPPLRPVPLLWRLRN